ncbi:MAG: S-layer homology domain-containing protein [Bacillota bacterium]
MRKIGLFILVTTFVLFSFQGSFAQTKTLTEIGTELKALGLLLGDPDGNMRFGDNISRVEFTAVAVRLIGKEKDALNSKGTTVFKDVPKDHWGTGHINISVNEKLIRGYEDGTFRFNNNITYGEALTIIVNALGYGKDVPADDWPNNFISKANTLGITKGVKVVPDQAVTRGDIAVMLYNSLTVKVKR